MNLQSMRKEISDLRGSLLYKYEPVCKSFYSWSKGHLPKPKVKPTGKLIPTHELSCSIAEIAEKGIRNKVFSRKYLILIH